MIDSKSRKYFTKIFQPLAKALSTAGLKPNQVTLIALIIGLLSALSLYFGWAILSFLLLWLSGLFDVLDGEMARLQKSANFWGAQIDILCDRIVELGIIWGLALRRPDALIALLCLLSCILISMTVFLTTATYTEKIKQTFKTQVEPQVRLQGKKKSFYYQAGLMERTEGFIAFSLMILLPSALVALTWIYAGLIALTIVQRLIEARRIFSIAEDATRSEKKQA